MNNRSLNRNKNRRFPGKGMTFGKMWLATPHISRFQAGMDITGSDTPDTKDGNDD